MVRIRWLIEESTNSWRNCHPSNVSHGAEVVPVNLAAVDDDDRARMVSSEIAVTAPERCPGGEAAERADYLPDLRSRAHDEVKVGSASQGGALGQRRDQSLRP